MIGNATRYALKRSDLIKKLIVIGKFDYTNIKQIQDTTTSKAKDQRQRLEKRGIIRRVNREGSHCRGIYEVTTYYKVLILKSARVNINDYYKTKNNGQGNGTHTR